MLAVIAVTLVGDVPGFGQAGAVRWTIYFVYCVVLSWLAISVHRMVLLEDAEKQARLDSPGLKRLGRFVGTMIGVWVFYVALNLLLIGIAMLPFARYVPAGAMPPPDRLAGVFPYINIAVNVLAMWPVARLSLLFPSLAVDQRFDPIAAWQASRGNGWKLVIVVGVLPWLLDKIGNALYRDEASWVEFGVLLVLCTVFTVIQVVALSLSYWELTQPEPPPTPPPA